MLARKQQNHFGTIYRDIEPAVERTPLFAAPDGHDASEAIRDHLAETLSGTVSGLGPSTELAVSNCR
jgi:hypothetical protein